MVDQTLLALGTILLLLAAEGTRYFVCTNEERNSKIWEVRRKRERCLRVESLLFKVLGEVLFKTIYCLYFFDISVLKKGTASFKLSAKIPKVLI